MQYLIFLDNVHEFHAYILIVNSYQNIISSQFWLKKMRQNSLNLIGLINIEYGYNIPHRNHPLQHEIAQKS